MREKLPRKIPKASSLSEFGGEVISLPQYSDPPMAKSIFFAGGSEGVTAYYCQLLPYLALFFE